MAVMKEAIQARYGQHVIPEDSAYSSVIVTKLYKAADDGIASGTGVPRVAPGALP